MGRTFWISLVRWGTIWTRRLSDKQKITPMFVPTCLSKVITPALLINNVLVDLAGRDVVVPSEGDTEIALIVSKVEIRFTTVI